MNEVSLEPKSSKGRRIWYGGSLLGLLVALSLLTRPWLTQQTASPVTPADTPADQPEVVLACPGRIEAGSETVKVGAGIDGLLKAVLVHEGQVVIAGQEVALIDRADLEAERQVALANAESARQSRVRLLRGSRTEERRMAVSQTAAAEARLTQARQALVRTENLFQSGDISAQIREQVLRDVHVAEAAMAAAMEQEKLVNAEPLPEEVAKIDAEIKAAEERIRHLTEQLKKCSIKAPLAGKVLRVHVKPGEMVSTVFPQPIISIADTSVWRVRAEVDERDLSRLQPRQRVLIQSEAFAGHQLHGTVAEMGVTMGRKQVRTGDPAEKSDRDILEVMIDLEPLERRFLVVGLRVSVQFLTVSPDQNGVRN